MRAVKSLLQQWLTVPGGLTSKQRWTYTALTVGIPLAWITHFGFIFLFLYWDILPLAAANVLSVSVWTFAIYTRNRLYLRLSYFIALAEILGHAMLCLLFLGWAFGIQYHLISILAVTLQVPLRKAWHMVAIWLLIMGVFVGGYLYTEAYPPLAEVDALQLQVMAVINMLAGFVMLGVVMFYVTATAERAEADLAVEHRKSEALLNNVMPTVIAARLKQDQATIAENFPDASVLFADLVGFTPLAEQLSPDHLVQLLDGLLSRFDELVDKYGLEKIKTVGDAYMVAAGVPIPRSDHAEAIADLALEMRAASVNYSHSRGIPLQLRLGISSGAVVAGVIGRRRFLYDLWGDTVNTAARMEEHGRSGEIQLSEATERLLHGKFVMKERGLVEIKGKRPMRTYWLESRPDVSNVSLSRRES